MSEQGQNAVTQMHPDQVSEDSTLEKNQTTADNPFPESVSDDTSLEQSLPDVADGTEQLSKLLPTATTVGFEQSAAAKPRVEMVIHEYDTPFFEVIARIAPNKTIDFSIKNKERPADEREQSKGDPLGSNAHQLLIAVTQFYLEDPVNKAAPALADPNFDVFGMLCKLPFSISVNIKPLLTCERIDDKNSTLLGLIQLRLNNTSDLAEGLARFVRVQKEISVGFFDAITQVIVAGYMAHHPDATDVSMGSIRYDYLHQIPGGLTGETKPKTFSKDDTRLNKSQSGNQTEPADSAPPKRMVDRREEQRRAPVTTPYESSIREIESRVRTLSRQSGEQYEFITAQLRTVQSQQTDIIEQNRAMLEDNQTLFQVINLLIKTIQAK